MRTPYVRLSAMEKLVLLRRRHGITAKRAAVLAGVNVRTLRSWEQGRATPHPANLAKVEAFVATLAAQKEVAA